MQDGLTDAFYRLTNRLQAIEQFLRTLNRLGIVTSDEMRVIYSSSHFTALDNMRKTK